MLRFSKISYKSFKKKLVRDLHKNRSFDEAQIVFLLSILQKVERVFVGLSDIKRL